MGILGLIASGIAAWFFYSEGHFMAVPAIINAIANLWSLGILKNFKEDPQNAPDGWTLINMATSVLGIILLIWSIFS